MTQTAIPFVWTDDGVMKPRTGFLRTCDANFAIGETYVMEATEERSTASHRHYFAAVREAFINLPEGTAQSFSCPEALRKFALIRAGYADSQTFVANSRAEALRVAAFMRPLDEFAVVTVEGSSVTRWTAQSQSMKAMGKARFQESKDAVMGVLADMIDIRRDDLEREAGRAA